MKSAAKVREEEIQDAIDRTDDILKLFTAILRTSELERGAAKKYFTALQLDEIVCEMCESYAPAIEDSGRSFDCAIVCPVIITGDRELISQIIANLLDNAMVHTPSGTRIALTLTKNSLVVADDGPGIPPGDRLRVFQRFVRLEESRSRPGYGLGLNLVGAVVDALGWKITIESNEPGARTHIEFSAP